MKRVLLWILALVVLAGAGAAFLVTRIDADFIVRRIADATQGATGAPLQLDAPPRISLLPPGIRFGGARWSGSLDGTDVSVSLQGGMAQLELAPLFSGNLVLSELQLDRPEAVIRLHAPSPAAGTDTAGKRREPQADQRAETRKAPDDALPLELRRLTVTQGALRLNDGRQETRVSGFNLSLGNLRRREEVEIQGDLVLEILKLRGTPPAGKAAPATAGGRESADATPLLAGNLAFKAALRYYAPNLTFRQTSLAFTPLKGALPRELAPLQLACEGALDLGSLTLRLAQARLSTPQARLTLNGQGTLAPVAFAGEAQLGGSPRRLAALAGAALPEGDADTLDIRCRAEYSGTTLRLADLSGQAAGVRLGGDLALGLPDGENAVPSVRGALNLGTIALDALLPGKGTAPSARQSASAPAAQRQAPRGGAPAAAPAQNAAGLPAVDLRLAIAGLRHGAFGLKDIATLVTGKAGRYALKDFSARLAGGGQLRGTFTADMAARAYTLAADGAGVDIGALCAAAGKAGVAGGSAAFTVRLRTAGADSRAMLAALEGEGVLEARDLTTPALREAAQTLRKLPVGNLAVPERIATARAPFTARKGEIAARPVTVTADGLSARGDLRANLPREFLEGTATVTTMGLNIPLTFKGPFSDVSVGVDPKFALELGRRLGTAPGALGRGARDLGTAGAAGAGKAGGAVREGLGNAGGLVRGLFGR